MAGYGTKRTHRDSPLFVRFRGRSGHQSAIAYGHATTLSLDQPLPGTDKMEMERRGFGGEVPHNRIFWRTLVTD
jgi:hypothetical protein